jgi:hypothetical protein
MVSLNMIATFSKKPIGGCVAGPPFLCSIALCCGAIHSICLLSLPDCAVLRGYTFFLSF